MISKNYSSFDAIIRAPFPVRLCHLAIQVSDNRLRELVFVSDRVPLKAANNPFSRQVVEQLRYYFSHPDFSFDLALEPAGTDFQKRVWRKLCDCPSGQVWSYGQLAHSLESGARAIGGACRRNPIPVVVPCHRVVAKQGIGGYAGKTSGSLLAIKQWLLQHESVA